MGKRRLGFGAIDGGVSGGIENEVGRGAADEGAGLIGIGEIDGFAIDGDDGTDAGKDAFQFAAKLAGIADDENAGISRAIYGRSIGVSFIRGAPKIWKCTSRILIGGWQDDRAATAGDGFAPQRDSPYNL